MNRRTPFERLLSFLVASVMLVTLGADAFGAHRCPHHDGLPGATATEPVAHHDHGAASAATDDSASHEHDGPCTCVGQCATSVGPAVASSSVSKAEFSAGAVGSTHLAYLENGAPRPEYLIPFATAPPA